MVVAWLSGNELLSFNVVVRVWPD